MKIVNQILVVCNVLLKALLLMLCYEWFVIPIFNLPDLTYLQSIGLVIFLKVIYPGFPMTIQDFDGYILDHSNWKEKEKVIHAAAAFTTLRYSILLLISYLLHFII